MKELVDDIVFSCINLVSCVSIILVIIVISIIGLLHQLIILPFTRKTGGDRDEKKVGDTDNTSE